MTIALVSRGLPDTCFLLHGVFFRVFSNARRG